MPRLNKGKNMKLVVEEQAWDELDEDISVSGLLLGNVDITKKKN